MSGKLDQSVVAAACEVWPVRSFPVFSMAAADWFTAPGLEHFRKFSQWDRKKQTRVGERLGEVSGISPSRVKQNSLGKYKWAATVFMDTGFSDTLSSTTHAPVRGALAWAGLWSLVFGALKRLSWDFWAWLLWLPASLWVVVLKCEESGFTHAFSFAMLVYLLGDQGHGVHPVLLLFLTGHIKIAPELNTYPKH